MNNQSSNYKIMVFLYTNMVKGLSWYLVLFDVDDLSTLSECSLKLISNPKLCLSLSVIEPSPMAFRSEKKMVGCTSNRVILKLNCNRRFHQSGVHIGDFIPLKLHFWSK
jgi:hypothetical protein